MAEQLHEEKIARHLKHLSEALDSGTQFQVRKLLRNLSGSEIGDLLESLPITKRLAVWELNDPDMDGEVLVHVNDEVRATLIRDSDPDELIAAVGELDLDDLADILNDLPDAVTVKVLNSMDQQDRDRLQQVLAYDEDSAGGLMNIDTITVRPEVTLEVVLRYLQRLGELPNNTDNLIVTTRENRYIGLLPLSTLVTSHPQSYVVDVMNRDV